jgi:hypothetical protein
VTSAASIQLKIDRGRGHAASKLGQPYSVSRLTPSVNGDFAGWPVITPSTPIFVRRLKSGGAIDSAIANATLFYEVVADMSPYVLGDLFQSIDPPYVPGVSYGLGATQVAGNQFNGFALAWHRPIAPSVAGRVDRLCRLYRPGAIPQTLLDGSPNWKTTRSGDQPFVMVNGQLVLGQPGLTASLVPCGLSSAYRPYGPTPFKPSPPAMTRPSHWFAYLPNLPGYTAREGDTLITDDDARYVVVEPFYQTAGVVGSQLILDRTGAQAT